MPKFNGHTYRWTQLFGSTNHHWELRTFNGGVHFTARQSKDYDTICGLEFHSIHPRGDDAPDHIDCPVTGGRCWHDGTSLYAVETLWPMIEPLLKAGDHCAIFRLLESESKRLIPEEA